MFCWNRSNSYNLLPETRRVINTHANFSSSKANQCMRNVHLTVFTTTKQHVKACYSHSTAKQAMHQLVTKSEKHRLSMTSWHLQTSAELLPCQQCLCLCTVHFPPAGHTAVQLGEGAMDTMPAPDHPRHQQNWLPFHCSQAVPDEEFLLGVVILIEGINDPLSPPTPLAEVPLFLLLSLHILNEKY